MSSFPCLVRFVSGSGQVRYRLGGRLVDRYLEFVAGRCRPNTLRAAFDLKVFVTGPPSAAAGGSGRRAAVATRWSPGSSSPVPDKPGLYCRYGVRLGWLRADRAEQQVINDLALPQQVDLP
jgi:hypothetical protein